MDTLQNRPGIAILVGAIAGLVLGLLMGWVIWPVEWTGAGPQHLAEADQARYLRLVADVYSHENNVQKVQQALQGWAGASVAACQLAATSADPNEAQRLQAIAQVSSGQNCDTLLAQAPPAEEEGGSFVTALILFLILGVLVVAILMVLNRRRALGGEVGTPRTRYADVPTAGPLTDEEDEGQATIPLARFHTTYTYGHDTYDDSFSIENASGDFLGECGVGISESIGTDTPKNVTGLEVWLFDKNDIRTITKVVMSEHAFHDEALKAKLAPKGEPVLAAENETIVLETATLIINATITEMEYGSSALPPQSFFERITFELSAWAKEGDFGESDVQGRVDQLLNY